jgi:arsenate reductase
VNEFAGARFDYVVTVCDRAKETCPIFPGARTVLHWSFDDPAQATGSADERRAVFTRVRDEIAGQIRRFLSEVR